MLSDSAKEVLQEAIAKADCDGNCDGCTVRNNGDICTLSGVLADYPVFKQMACDILDEEEHGNHRAEEDFNQKMAERATKTFVEHKAEFERAPEEDWWEKPHPAIDLVSEERVDHPHHYQSDTGIECIEAIEAALGDLYPGFLIGNVFKYLWRYKDKGGDEDLRKAHWYLSLLLKTRNVAV